MTSGMSSAPNRHDSRGGPGDQWPPLPLSEWERTRDTLHMWMQMVGKTRLAFTPLVNHWWNVTLYVTARGLTTSAIPYGGRIFDVEFDFITHTLLIRTSDGASRALPLSPRPVADFYAEYAAALGALGIDLRISTTPSEVPDPIPFERDREHASYDPEYAHRFWRVLTGVDRVFKEFRARFIGKCSPVHFFWGSFDLAVSRFSGRRAPERKDADSITREGYSHEVISCGFWPGDNNVKTATFYCYTAPAPPGLEREAIRPNAASYNAGLGMFLLKYDDVRVAESPTQALLEFCQSTYEAGARLAKWDRESLERRSDTGA